MMLILGHNAKYLAMMLLDQTQKSAAAAAAAMDMEEERMSKMKKSLASPLPPLPKSISALPNDVSLNYLARISRFHLPALSLVSKNLRSLIASPDLDDTRSRIGKTENLLYVCLDLKTNPNPSWFILSPIPSQKLKPVTTLSFPHQQHPKSASFVSIGSEVYVIGGLVNGEKSKRVFVLDCRSQHQWRTLPEMLVPRETPAVDVIDGKIYVIGGVSWSRIRQDWGEVYDPETQIWEPLSSPTEALEGKLVLDGKDYPMHGLRMVFGGRVYSTDRMKFGLIKNICLVEVDNVLCQTLVSHGTLIWFDPKVENMEWSKVKGLEELEKLLPSSYFPYHLTSNTTSGEERRVTVWWKLCHLRDHITTKWETEIWCAEISFERRSSSELWGFLEWSRKVFTFEGCDSGSDFVLHSALMTL